MTVSFNNVKQVLLNGPPLSRAVLLANHIADINSDGKGLLTPLEFTTIERSFKSPKEIETYNRVRRISEDLQYFVSFIAQLRLSFVEVFGRLDKVLTARALNSDFEDATNTLLMSVPKEKRSELAKKIRDKYTHPQMFRPLSLDKDGFIKVDYDNSRGIETVGMKEYTDNLKESSKRSLTRAKTGITLVKDCTSSTKVKITFIENFIKEVEKDLKDASTKGYIYLYSQRKEVENPIYKIDFNYNTLEIDQDYYKQLKEGYLNGWK